MAIVYWRVTREQLNTPIVELERYGLEEEVIGTLERLGIWVVGDLQQYSIESLVGKKSGLKAARIKSLQQCLQLFLTKKRVIK
ncbi:hypothetical protein M0R72_14630 [Candidatus Pacearchaeota archaeon]|jgi:hypothetical protein|nr:hypothetical protein [Candidatus Pacearchaeota archaeon]